MSKTNSAIAGASTGASVGGPWGAAIGGVAGYLLGSDDKSMSYEEQLMREAQKIPLPLLKEYFPEMYRQVVALNPEMETAVNLGPSAMEGVATDPALRQAQLDALDKLQGIGAAGGRDAEFEANMARLESDINTNLAGQQGALMQNLETRGVGGGGAELVARNMNTQGAANRQAQMAMDEKAQAERRALDAIMASGEMAGNMQARDFSQQSDKAKAADTIAKFNAQNQQQVISNNVGARNNAQQWNATNTQSISNQNTGLRNDQQNYNNNISQRNYDNQLAKYGLVSDAGSRVAEASARNAARQDQFLGDSFGAIATAYGDKKKKKDEV